MKILIALTYYRPWVSGLTIYAERLARTLAGRGHQVTVLTSHYEPALPFQEVMDGVVVVRHPVLFRFSKASIMPGFLTHAVQMMRDQDVVHVHLPQAEGGMLAFIARQVAHKPVFLTYHCDLQLPPGAVNRLIDEVNFASNVMAAGFANRIVTYTEDFAENSRLLSKFKSKLRVIYPPVEIAPPDPAKVLALKERCQLDGRRVIGFAARFAEEKGVGYLLDSIPYVRESFPAVKYLFAGQYRDVVGENVWERLQPQICQLQDYVAFLGPVPSAEMGSFFGACDVLTVSSINSTESFGLVQVEAMLTGCPVVATNLPGVREPVRVTRMGEVVAIKDARALADGIVKVLQNRSSYIRPREEITKVFSLDRTVREYEKLFEETVSRG